MIGSGSNVARVVITADDRTGGAFASLKQNLAGVGSVAGSVTRLISGIGSAAAVVAITGMVRRTADYADEMGKLAQRAGVTTEAISALAYAARLSDVDNQTLARGLRELGNDAADGGKKLSALGIAIKDTAGNAKTSDALLMNVADTIAGMEDPAQRAAAAAKLFGDRIGPELIPLLAGGAKGLREATAEAAKFGKVVSEQASVAAQEFNDNLSRMGELAGGAGMKIANNLLPVLNELLKSMLSLPKTFSLSGLAGDVLSLDKQLKALEVRKASPFNFAANLDQEIATTREKLAEAKRLFNAADTGRPLSAGGGRGFVNPARVVPVSAVAGSASGAPSRASGGRASASTPLTYDQDISQRIGKLIEQSDVIKAKEYADTLTELDRLFFTGALQADLYDGAVSKLSGSTAEAGEASTELAEQQARLAQLLAGTASAAIEAQQQDMLLLAAAFDKGTISAKQFEEASAARLGLTGPESTSAVASFSETLHEDVKGALSTAFQDTKDPLRAFGDALSNVVFTRVSSSMANAIADGLLGSGGSGGGLLSSAGSWLSKLFSFDGGGYTGSGPRSGGMDGKGGFLAMVHPNETVVDHSKGQRAGSTVINISIPTTVGNIASQQDVVAGMQAVRAQIVADLQRSMKYGGQAA